jgi:hypothetical protein
MDMSHLKIRSSAIFRNLLTILVIPAILFVLFASVVKADQQVDVRIKAEPPLPKAVQTELVDIFSDTLTNVLFSSQSIENLRNSEPTEIASAISTGINIVIEPKGYTVANLVIDLASYPVTADFMVHPTGWTTDNPHAVVDVTAHLSDKELGTFWQDKLGMRFSEHMDTILDTFRQNLLGLPSDSVDREWALNLVLPDLKANDPSGALFPDFNIEYSVVLGPVADVTLTLVPSGNRVELIRTRMYSRTISNLIMDRLRERLIAIADFLEGMPKSEVEAASAEISSELSAKLQSDPLARRFGAKTNCKIFVLPEEPVVMITANVESTLYDLELEGFVDFGNESRDSTEIEGRAGVLMGDMVEFFVNLNYFTNDNTLDTDLAVGFIPMDGTFVAVGYDLSRKDPKYFIEQSFGNGIGFRSEIFKIDDLNEFGLTYQFQQYLSAGLFSNGNNEYWVRAIVRL